MNLAKSVSPGNYRQKTPFPSFLGSMCASPRSSSTREATKEKTKENNNKRREKQKNLDRPAENFPAFAAAHERGEEEKTKISLITAAGTAIIAPRGLCTSSIFSRSLGSLSGDLNVVSDEAPRHLSRGKKIKINKIKKKPHCSSHFDLDSRTSAKLAR